MEDETYNQDISVVVSSCDKYSWVWGPFFSSIRKYWSNCSYKLFLSSNTISLNDQGVETLLSGPDEGWSDTLIENISKVSSEYVVFLQDDFILEKMVNTALLNGQIEAFRKHKGLYLKLYDKYIPYNGSGDAGIYREPPHKEYRISLQASLWDREFLLSILIKGETPWQFEQNAYSRCSDHDDRIFTVNSSAFRYFYGGVIRRGRIAWNYYVKFRFSGHRIGFRHLMGPLPFLKWYVWYLRERNMNKTVLPGYKNVDNGEQY